MKRGLVAVAALATAAHAGEPDPRRLELGFLPALAYDSDSGLGIGAIGTLARFAPEVRPYRWRLQAQLYLTVKEAPGGGVELPYQDHYLRLDVPGLAGDRLRLGLRLAFSRTLTAGYYGLGSGSTIDDARLAATPRAYAYDRWYPELEPSARVALSRASGKLDAVFALRAAYNVVRAYPGSQLADDDSAGAVDGVGRHLLGVASAGLLWDTRDHESVPSRGMLDELTLRGGVGLGDGFAYAGARAAARGFLPLWGERLVLGLRGVVDALAGRPPVYELALGGATTLRGVRAGRYHGKVKAYASAELRATLWSFGLGGQRFALGILGFADGGQVLGNGELDGGGLATGAGGGLRLRWGEHFLIRVDLAASPSEGTTGLYIDANHVF